MKRQTRCVALAALVGMLLVPGLARAVPILITDRASLGGNDFLNWRDFGPDLTAVPGGSSIASNSGAVNAQVSNPLGNFTIHSQSNTWHGNFAAGDPVLYSRLSPMVISFDSPVQGAGAQIQAGFLTDFTAYLDVYAPESEGGALLASLSRVGVATNAADNSAIFLGALDTSATIGRIEYSVDIPGFENALGINRLDLVVPKQVPEPATLLLLGSGLAGVLLTRRRLRA